MQHLRIRLIAVFALAVVFTSCSKTNKQGRYIPKDAVAVLQIDGKALQSKVSWDEIKQNPMIKEALADSSTSAIMKKILENPENSGIDTKTDLLLFIQRDSTGGFVGFEGTVKDDKAFSTFNLQLTHNGSESEKDGVHYISSFPAAVGWTNEKFIYVFDAPGLKEKDEFTRRMQQNDIDLPQDKPRDIGATCKSVFALKEDNSLGKNNKFSKLLTEAGDMHFWINVEELYKHSVNIALAMANLDDFYKGSICTGIVDFENGKIKVGIKSYAGDQLLSFYKKYNGGKVNEEMLQRIPGKNIAALMAVHFDPEALDGLVKMFKMDGMANMGAKQFGFTWQDFIKANKGDVLFSAADITLKKDSMLYAEPGMENARVKPEAKLLFATSIGDKEAFNKLIVAGKMLGEKEFGDDPGKAPIAYNNDDKYFALSNDKNYTDQYLSGKSNTGNADFVSKLTGEPFAFYANFQSIFKAFEQEAAKDSIGKLSFDASVKMWDNAYMKGGKLNNDAMNYTVEINLVDKNTNSLKQLNQYIYRITELHKERKKKEDAAMEEEMMDAPTEEPAHP